MPSPTTLLSLPTSLLLLLLTVDLPAQALHSPNLHINITSESDQSQSPWEGIIRHDAAIRRRLRLEQPTAVRKMTDDEGEKFWMDYWHFTEGTRYHRRDTHSLSLRDIKDENRGHQIDNSSLFQPAYPLHLIERNTFDFSLFGRGALISHRLSGPAKRFFSSSSLFKRDFQCPANTRPCASISRPNSCCTLGTTCQIISDTGFGDVGCCSGGSSSSNKCSGRIESCPEGHADCTDFPGGGCCIPGYTCVKDGCLFISTQTVTITASTSLIPPTRTTKTTTQINPPIRPTSNPIYTTTATISPSSTSAHDLPDDGSCPIGFYACSAVYQAGGCCRTGRDCNPTSCPPLATLTTINTNGVTIVVQVSATATDRPTSRCANGWATCGADVGGGCCPAGFRCGQESCTLLASAGGSATASATGGGGGEVVDKVPPEESAGNRVRPHGITILRALGEPRYFYQYWIALGVLGLFVGWLS